VIGFAGPGWNEARRQRAIDSRNARRAIRLIKVEIDEASALLWVLKMMDADHALAEKYGDAMPERIAADIGEILDRLPLGEDSEWARHRADLAELLTDETAWNAVARFSIDSSAPSGSRLGGRISPIPVSPPMSVHRPASWRRGAARRGVASTHKPPTPRAQELSCRFVRAA
jgi:hypothetical protein